MSYSDVVYKRRCRARRGEGLNHGAVAGAREMPYCELMHRGVSGQSEVSDSFSSRRRTKELFYCEVMYQRRCSGRSVEGGTGTSHVAMQVYTHV